MACNFCICVLLGSFLILEMLTSVNGAEDDYFTTQEKEAIGKLRPLVSLYLTHDYMKTDLYLLRWLKASRFDIQEAMKLLKTSNKWRTENNINLLLTENMDMHKRFLPYKIDGVDRKGNPILQIPYGRWDIRRYVVAGNSNTVLRYWWQMTEKLEQKVYEIAKSTGRNISQFYFLDDLDGFSISQQGCLQCVPIIYNIARSHDPNHPHFISGATFVNAPRIFSPILLIIKELVAGPTLKAIETFGHEKDIWSKHLQIYIEPNQLPQLFGGTKIE